MTAIEIAFNNTKVNHTKDFEIIIKRMEDHHYMSENMTNVANVNQTNMDITMNPTNIPWGLLEKHECEL